MATACLPNATVEVQVFITPDANNYDVDIKYRTGFWHVVRLLIGIGYPKLIPHTNDFVERIAKSTRLLSTELLTLCGRVVGEHCP